MKRFNIILIAFVLIFYFSSNNSFSQWIQTSAPFGTGNDVVEVLVSDGEKIFAGSRYGGFYISTDGGANWEQRNNGMSYIDVLDIVILGECIFATGDAIYKSTDDGLNWSQVFYSLGELTNSLFVKENILFAGTYKYHAGGIYRSTDEGNSWEEINIGLPMWNDIQSFAFNGNYLYAIEYTVGAFRSNDNGDSWELVKNGLPQYYVYATHLITDGFNIFLGSRGNGIYRSTNDGLDWIAVNYGLPSEAVIGAFAVIGNNLFAGTAGGPSFTPSGIYLSTNDGENWIAVNDGLPNISDIRSICINGNNIFVGTSGNGLWYRPLSELITDVVGEVLQIPKEYKLEQNYPNPFNPTTTISFSIPQSQTVELKVFDMLGNEVATLINEYKEVGKHKVQFDGSNLTKWNIFLSD